MGATERLRFRNYVVAPNLMVNREFRARCVSGSEAECGAESALSEDIKVVDEWIVQHFHDTAHDAFRRVIADYAVVRAGEWL